MMGSLLMASYYIIDVRYKFISEEPVKGYKRSHRDNRMPYEDNVGPYKDK